MPIQLNSYAEFQKFMDDTCAAVGAPIDLAPHHRFWSVAYNDFITGNVFGVQILIVGNAADSGIIHALKGEAPFDGTSFPQMPPTAAFPQDAIDTVADWINRNCPS